MNTTYEEQQAEYDLAPDSQFESYYDGDSGRWSLRRVPTTPPAALADDAEA